MKKLLINILTSIFVVALVSYVVILFTQLKTTESQTIYQNQIIDSISVKNQILAQEKDSLFSLLEEERLIKKTIVVVRDSLVEIIAQMPSNEVYDNLQENFPDSSKKEFLFSEKQIKDIYTAVTTGVFDELIIQSLNNQIGYYTDIVDVQKDELINSKKIIELQKKDLDLLSSKVVNKDGQIKKLEQQQKHLKIITGVIGVVGVLALIF